MNLADDVDYPIIAVGDLHGRRRELERLVAALERRPEWPDCALVFLGDYVDRGPDSRGTIDLVLELLRRPAGGSAVMGNHDLALIRSARLDGGPLSPYWIDRYKAIYDCEATFASYLGRPARLGVDAGPEPFDALREAMPEAHRAFLTGLRWVVEAPGHLFLHCGLSPELEAGAVEQVAALRARRWDRAAMRPRADSVTAMLWEDEYPVWLGADRSLSASPSPFPGKVQVTGHERVARPEADAVRIRLDTGGGYGEPTACLLRSPDAAPEFIRGR
ncbi:metallophosphoesterase [Paludisphaera mucosa]|uniref:Metallophosphoesterase n=1 Tax=Paludisphaera mucosa TaxID=3030827 RepID=A0ABT6FA95_9BACT|nr:metallophosphoesterase [Paludisphaera mucosa]MDG3004475.1 metallophosphoesterase [Paludisphaera mucosa]